MASTSWRSYEEVAIYLLNQFADKFQLGHVEGKQKLVDNHSGTTWEIDGKGVMTEGQGFVIVECRRYTKSKQKQEEMASIAYRIKNTGAAGGIIVSPLGLQAGADKIARAENIMSVQMNENSTKTKYVVQFLNSIFVGMEEAVTSEDSLEIKVVKNGKPLE